MCAQKSELTILSVTITSQQMVQVLTPPTSDLRMYSEKNC
jgi:hypothetical protein